MAEEQIKNAAKNVVDDILNGVNTKIKGGDSDKACQRSLLCVLFSPSMYFFFCCKYMYKLYGPLMEQLVTCLII